MTPNKRKPRPTGKNGGNGAKEVVVADAPIVTPAMPLPVEFTAYKSTSGPLSKAFKLLGEKIEKQAAADMAHGIAKRVRCDFSGFGEYLLSADHATAFGYGLPVHDEAHVVMDRDPKAGHAIPINGQTRHYIARTRQYLAFANGPGVLMLDHDPHTDGKAVESPAALLSILESIAPAIAESAAIWRGSVSARVVRGGGDPEPSKGFRVYLPVLDASDIPRVGGAPKLVGVLFKRLWLAGYGYIAVSSSGSLLVRTAIDGVVFQPERLDFVGRPLIIGDGLDYRPETPGYREGGYLDTRLALPDLGDEDEREYQRLVDEAKGKAKPIATEKAKAFAVKMVERIVKRGVSKRSAEVAVKRMVDGKARDLFGAFPLDFDRLGTVTVADVLADPAKYDRATLADPVEGVEYGRGKAMFYGNEGTPYIHSFAHGESRYFLHSEAPAKFSDNNKKSYTSYTSNTGKKKSYTDGNGILHPVQDSPIVTVETGAFLGVDTSGAYYRIIDSEAALTLAEAMRGKFAYASVPAAWHQFTGTHWQPLESMAVPERAMAGAFYAGFDPIGFKPAHTAGITKIMLSADMIPLPPEPTGKIPFRNGLLNIATGELEPVTADNATTWCVPHDYAAGMDCPFFLNWLQSTVDGDVGLTRLLRAFINACIVGRADLQKFLMLLGPGGTGKSTFIRLLFAILGPANCASTDLRRLEQNQFETATLYGKRLAAITDSDKYGGAVNVLKAITGQDPVRNERKHVQQSGTFVYSGMVVIASNEPLQSTDYTSGLERRRLVVQFDRRIPPNEMATFLAEGGEERLHREIPGIIDWALGLGRDEVTEAFKNPPAKATEAALESLTAQNPIADWITQNLMPELGAWTQIGEKNESRTPGGAVVYEDADTKLYPNYLRWCRKQGRESLALRRFRHAIVDMLQTFGVHVIESRRARGQGIQGIRTKGEWETPHQWPGMAPMQDETYTDARSSAWKKTPEPAPVQDMSQVTDFSPTLFGNFCAACNHWTGHRCTEGKTVSDPDAVTCGQWEAIPQEAA